jgi:hypothetical protein
MNPKEILRARLHFQKLDKPAFKNPAEMVKYFGAVQAQDFLGSLWAVGQRVENATEEIVEKALNDGKIVRSWPMRGTIHFTAPEDLGWMLDLLGQRAIAKSVTYQRDAGLTEKDFVKSRKIFEKELQGKTLERTAVYEILERKGIDTGNTRGLHIIGQMAREKVICFGPRSGKQPTFVLFDEWIKKSKKLSQEQALAELALRYFTSHGPATVYDFAWWSGLTITDAAKGIDIVQSKLQKIDNYWMTPGEITINPKYNVNLISAYDEFLVGYQDRSAAETEAINKLKDINAIFTSTVIVNGHIAGIWKRTIDKKGVKIKMKYFEKITKQAEAAVAREMRQYGKFIGMELIS